MAAAKKQIQVTSKWLGNRRFKAEGQEGRYPVMMDADADNGGEGLGNSPLELVITGLVGCIGIGIVHILEKMRQPADTIEITANAARAETVPHEITEVHLTFHVKGEVAASRILQAVKLECGQYCPVAASLKANVIPHVVLNGVELRMDDQGFSSEKDRE